MFRSSSLRLALFYTAGFSLAVVVLGLATAYATRGALSQEFDARIRTEAAALVQEFNDEGLQGLRDAVSERDQTPGAVDYGLREPGGKAMAGSLAAVSTAPGWSNLRMTGTNGGDREVRILTTVMPGGYRLMIGDDREHVEVLDGIFLRSFAWTLSGVVLLGLLGGFALSRDVHRRLAAITATAEAIIDGDLARRVPVGGSDDDLGRLAATLNRMLDRISALMDSLKQVSTDIAHDLRTPLTRLRQRLEDNIEHARLGRADDLEATLTDLDEILGTFAALMRIAQIEGGVRRAGFQPTDLASAARTAAEAFLPTAEDAGQTLVTDCPLPVVIHGDRELLVQMVVNLIENALRHAGQGANVVVRAVRDGADAVVRVSDDGPGIPPEERDRVLDRFYRLERSRTTPGSGLGLALVAAVARLHRAQVMLEDAEPGLTVTIRFPAD